MGPVLVGSKAGLVQGLRRPGEGRDPYSAAVIASKIGGRLSYANRQRWSWVPAFAGTTKDSILLNDGIAPVPASGFCIGVLVTPWNSRHFEAGGRAEVCA